MDAVETIMELVCDCCHWPYVESEEGLEDRCEQCEVEKAIRQALKRAADIDKRAE